MEWWRIRGYLQRGTPRGDDHIYTVDDLTAALYSHVYAVPAEAVREAAAHRAAAMRIRTIGSTRAQTQRVRPLPPSATTLSRGALLRAAVR